MTSDLKLAANRANALLSTGPRSARGKKRSRLNAKRHGLAQDIRRDLTFRRQVEALAATLSNSAGERKISEDARKAAAAEFDLLRIREVQSAMYNDLLRTQSLSERVTLQQQLSRLQRYERRAYSRRRRAMRSMADRSMARPADHAGIQASRKARRSTATSSFS